MRSPIAALLAVAFTIAIPAVSAHGFVSVRARIRYARGRIANHCVARELSRADNGMPAAILVGSTGQVRAHFSCPVLAVRLAWCVLVAILGYPGAPQSSSDLSKSLHYFVQLYTC